MILCYEIFLADREEPAVFSPRLATVGEVEGLYAHIAAVLLAIGFLNPQNPEYWMTHIRRFLARTALQAKEVKILRGICRQLQWYLAHKKT
jgi:tRNA/rRNA methyltransferase